MYARTHTSPVRPVNLMCIVDPMAMGDILFGLFVPACSRIAAGTRVRPGSTGRRSLRRWRHLDTALQVVVVVVTAPRYSTYTYRALIVPGFCIVIKYA